MKILLHTCCAPCMIYPLERLKGQGHNVTGYFYNPNIHPLIEFRNRKDAVKELSKELDFKVDYPGYAPEDFFREVNLKETNPVRCQICWGLRLRRTAKESRAGGFDAFTTTLLVSPYQDQELLKKIGSGIAQEEGVEFYYEDFRPGFRQAHQEAKAKGVYCQKYCGCIYSEIERYSKKEQSL